jgi:23S rRNA pseudouridine1911/1915/1917 synthase
MPAELAGKRLDQALAALFPDYSRSRIKDWILAGRVTLDGDAAAPRTRVAAGQQVELQAVLEVEVTTDPERMDIDVVYEDESVLVINKPVGLVVHPGAGNPQGTLVNGLLHYVPDLARLPRGGLLHRLDKDTSGLLLVAKTLAAHTHLVRDLQDRRIMREYRAVCVGRLTAGGTVDVPIGRHPVQRTRMAVNERGKEAVTHYRVLRRFAGHSFIAARLESGRTHQIRVHLAHIRHPLVGDQVYGGRFKLPRGLEAHQQETLRRFRRQALHASRLAFRHPVDGQGLHFHAPLPQDLRELLAALEGPASRVTDYDSLTWPEQTPASR